MGVEKKVETSKKNPGAYFSSSSIVRGGVARAVLFHHSGPTVPAGLWFDLEVSYSGSFLMTLETKMNLIRLGKEDESSRLGEVGKDG